MFKTLKKIRKSKKSISLGMAGISLLAAATVVSCDNKGSDNTMMNLGILALLSQPVTGTIDFQVTANDAVIGCSTSPATGTAIAGYTNDGTTHNIKVLDSRFYISNIKLVDSNDNLVDVTLTANDFQDPTSGVALMDFEDKTGVCVDGNTETHTQLQLSYPRGSYKGIQFDVGIPDNYNRLYYNTAPSDNTPNVYRASKMYWTWASAYKFAKFEFKDTITGNVTVLHLGSLGNSVTGLSCDDSTLTSVSQTNVASPGGVPNACIYQNRPTVRLTGASFDPSTNKVSLDLVDLFSGANTIWGGTAGASCMSGRTNTSAVAPYASTLKAPCTDLFANIGVSATTGGSTGSQTVFGLL